MMYANIVSVTLYFTLCFFIVKQKHLALIACIMIIEIVFHAALATIFVGWQCGFPLYLVCILPVPFYLDFKREYIPYIISFSILASFLLLKAYISNSDNIINSLDGTFSAVSIYFLNSLVASLMIICTSIIYRISKQVAQTKLKAKNETLSRLATIDPLTQLFNRRAMTEYMKIIHENAQATNKSYTVAMGDIDNFKAINDTYGHSIGDVVLREICSLITQAVPSEGYICRWGGEEVLIVLPNAKIDEGDEMCNKICQTVSNHYFKCDDNKFTVTITFGVCECNGDISYEKAIKTADDYLYIGKKTGKNCVIDSYCI